MNAAPRCVIAIDAGTTGVRSRAVFATGGGQIGRAEPPIACYREFTQHFPEPGWVEHDATEIWEAVKSTLNDVVQRVGIDNVAAIGITNQRETVLAWSRRTGKPYGTAIVWQDRRTAQRCDQLTTQGLLPMVREATGLVLDPYFSGSKVEWLLANRAIPIDDDLAIGTIDSWLLWNLTGGTIHATDPSNASRTMLFDIRKLQWSHDLCALFGVPISALAAVLPSSGRFGVTSDACGAPPGIPIAGIAGDQQAALFGQACFTPGMAKNTYGTGSFVLLNVGEQCPPVAEGMLTTVAWSLGDTSLAEAATTYALEGAIFVTGAAVQWLRDGIGVISTAAEIGPLAASVADNGGVYLVPAFTGLGSPWWDPYARGTIVGITRGSTRAHLARAVVEAMAYQTRDAVEAMSSAAGVEIRDLRVDGGASAMDEMLQFQADQLGVTVRRP
ncbi:MAG: glycerol kinase GlpK, partial [Actinobacteria bacterium]|nr:glycerol kinase GlpK [Actinomycetota bacterium]